MFRYEYASTLNAVSLAVELGFAVWTHLSFYIKLVVNSPLYSWWHCRGLRRDYPVVPARLPRGSGKITPWFLIRWDRIRLNTRRAAATSVINCRLLCFSVKYEFFNLTCNPDTLMGRSQAEVFQKVAKQSCTSTLKVESVAAEVAGVKFCHVHSKIRHFSVWRHHFPS